ACDFSRVARHFFGLWVTAPPLSSAAFVLDIDALPLSFAPLAPSIAFDGRGAIGRRISPVGIQRGSNHAPRLRQPQQRRAHRLPDVWEKRRCGFRWSDT